MTEIIINVDGMSCEHCVKAITKVISSLDGVKAVRVSLSDKNVNLKYNNTKISLEKIKELIENQGYDIL